MYDFKNIYKRAITPGGHNDVQVITNVYHILCRKVDK